MNREIVPSSSVYRPWGNGNYYSYSSLFFSELKENETWNLSNLNTFSPIFFSFLIIRSSLFLKSFDQKMTLESIPNSVKNSVLKNLEISNIASLKINDFIPKLITNSPQKTISKLRIRFSNDQFYLYHRTGNVITRSGGYLVENAVSLKDRFENSYRNISRKKNSYSGNLFFIQNNFSIFGEFGKDKPSKNLFVQSFEKKITLDFLFWISEIKLSD